MDEEDPRVRTRNHSYRGYGFADYWMTLKSSNPAIMNLPILDPSEEAVSEVCQRYNSKYLAHHLIVNQPMT